MPTSAVNLRRAMRQAGDLARRCPGEVPADLRARLETARLDWWARFRALDRMDLAPCETPQRAHPTQAQLEVTIRHRLLPAEAHSVPGRDPQIG